MDHPSRAEELRALLLEYSDHRAVRRLFGTYTDEGVDEGTEAVDLLDLVEAMQASNGSIALTGDEGDAEVYARWNAERGRYEHVTIWPPWTVGDYGHADRADIRRRLSAVADLRPTPHSETPFSNQAALEDARRRH